MVILIFDFGPKILRKAFLTTDEHVLVVESYLSVVKFRELNNAQEMYDTITAMPLTLRNKL